MGAIRNSVSQLLPQGIGRQAALVVIGDAINFTTGFISSMILARIIPVDVMGTYRQVMYLAPMVASIVELGISGTVYRYWNFFDEAQRASYTKMITIVTCFLGVIGTAILAVCAVPLARWYHNPALQTAVLITAAYPMATIPLMLLRPVLLSQGYSLRATFLETFFSLMSILSILMPLWMGLSLNAALSIWIIVSLLRLVAFPLFVGEYLQLTGSWWDWHIMREVWSYLWPIQVGRLPGYITSYLDKVVTSLFFSTKDFAIYSMGAREIPFIGVMGMSVANVLTPHLVDDIKEQRYGQAFLRWRKACERTALVTYPIAAFCCWYAVPVMQFLYSATYTESSIPFQVFAALTFVRVVEYASLAKAMGRSDLIMRYAFVGAGVMFLCIVPLGWMMKGFGIALAFLLATLASSTYILFKYKQIFNVNINTFFPWPRLSLILLISLISAACSSFILGPVFVLNNNLGIFNLGAKLGALFAASCAVYVVLLWVIGFIKIRKYS